MVRGREMDLSERSAAAISSDWKLVQRQCFIIAGATWKNVKCVQFITTAPSHRLQEEEVRRNPR